MKELKNYQIMAIEQLSTFTNMYLNTPKNETIVFQSPTGSGKTLMMSRFILELTEKTTEDLCFLWISIGKGDLQVQSYKSVKNEIGDAIECSLLESEFFGSRDIINKNEIVFVNWEKIRNKDRATGEFKNTLMKDWEQNNFPTILENTRRNRKIILIIDESHSGATTERAMEIRDEIIRPELTFEMSATPVFTGDNMNARVSVDPTDVINEGIIKKEIIINDKIAEVIEKEENETTSEKIVLESAYQKEEELKERYKKAFETGTSENPIVPLTLIQIPNSAYGESKREAVEKFLEAKGITTENGRLAVWLSDEKINDSYDELNKLDSKVEYLIFKMAIDTGWDCPRAQILLKFREVNSIVFEIQTVGRILRMPEAKHYDDEELNVAYVYSNIQSISIKKEIYNPNIIKSLRSVIREEYRPATNFEIKENTPIEKLIDATNKESNSNNNITSDSSTVDSNNESYSINNKKGENETSIIEELQNSEIIQDEQKEKVEKKQLITLKSYYKKRTDYGDITQSFYKVYEREFCKYFGITEKNDMDMPDSITNNELLKSKGVVFEFRKKDSIMSDVHIESEKFDKGIEIDEQESLVDIIMSDSDLEYDFEKVIQNNLNGFAPARSISTVKMAIINSFIKYLGLKPQNKGIILMQNLVVNNSDIFGNIINIATEKYKPLHEYEVEQKEGFEINENWTIPYDKNFNPNTYVKIESKLSIYKPLYMETKNGKVDNLEVEFIKYLDEHEDAIEYFWKNGSEHMNTNFGIRKPDGSAFQPDFIIQFKNGKVGIFDTKGKGFNEKDNEIKANALQQYIADENNNGKNLVGGLVIKDNNKFYYNDRTNYKEYNEKPEDWKPFNELLK